MLTATEVVVFFLAGMTTETELPMGNDERLKWAKEHLPPEQYQQMLIEIGNAIMKLCADLASKVVGSPGGIDGGSLPSGAGAAQGGPGGGTP